MTRKMIIPPNEPCDANCPVRLASDLVGYKWTTLIVRDLLPGKQRYSQLLRSISGISPRVLAQRLHELEEAGVITRTLHPTVPPTTEYELTKLGRKLESVINAMAEFGVAMQKSARLSGQSHNSGISLAHRAK